jgi:glycosyltransferase involved in cell wall biosynthesis
MHIAFLNKYQNKVFRGAETFVYELSRRLSKNHEVDVISDVNYFTLLRKKYDLIIPTNGRCQAIIVRKIALLTGARMIVSGQSGIGWDDRVNLYSFPDVFVALSSKALNWAKKINPLVKSVYIPNGVDLEKFTFKGSPFKVSLKKPIVLVVGAFTEQKRMDLTIKAVAKINGASLLMIGGGGELQEELNEEGKRLLGEKFELKSVPFEKMPEIYRCADVFTLPSAPSESFGNVLVEAMASGLPVVATDDPIRREIVGNAGIFVDPTNINEYAKALETALKTNWGDKPRRQTEKFSWDEIAKKYNNLLIEIIKR